MLRSWVKREVSSLKSSNKFEFSKGREGSIAVAAESELSEAKERYNGSERSEGSEKSEKIDFSSGVGLAAVRTMLAAKITTP